MAVEAAAGQPQGHGMAIAIGAVVIMEAVLAKLEARKPLQNPPLQVLVAHWLFEVQDDWKEPHVLIVLDVTP
jgi:hypothetical protein